MRTVWLHYYRQWEWKINSTDLYKPQAVSVYGLSSDSIALNPWENLHQVLGSALHPVTFSLYIHLRSTSPTGWEAFSGTGCPQPSLSWFLGQLPTLSSILLNTSAFGETLFLCLGHVATSIKHPSPADLTMSLLSWLPLLSRTISNSENVIWPPEI